MEYGKWQYYHFSWQSPATLSLLFFFGNYSIFFLGLLASVSSLTEARRCQRSKSAINITLETNK